MLLIGRGRSRALVAPWQMRLVVVGLLLLLSPTLAFASGVRLLADRVRLDEPWLPTLSSAQLKLTPPCLACHRTSFTSVPVELALQLSSGLGSRTGRPRASNGAGSARRAQASALAASRRGVALGDSWQLGHGRELSIRLTPTQQECAPLMRLKF